MRPEHVISDEVFNEIQSAILRNKDWLAYNSVNYFLGKTDVYFFRTKEEAQEFSDNNLSEYDDFNIIHFQSAADVLRQIPYGEYQNNILSLKNNYTMNEQNFDYLKNQLKYTGFGEDLQRELREKMATGAADFTLMHKPKFGEEHAEAMLHFKKSEQGEMYFFNRYFLQLQTDKPNEAIAQSFRVGRENNITLKEAYNLMQGRSVYKELQNKEGEKYHAWLQLNFKETNDFGDYKMKQFHENYGYNLEKELAKFPIKELSNNSTKELFIKSLQKGNMQNATIGINGRGDGYFVAANPQFKTIDMFDKNAKPLSKDMKESLLTVTGGQNRKEGETISTRENQASSNNQNTSEKNEERKEENKTEKKSSTEQWHEEKHETKHSKKSGKALQEDDLLPKKRVNHKKGLSI